MREVAHARKQNPSDMDKICRMVGISGVITYANLGDDRLRGSGWWGGNFALPHTLLHYRASVFMGLPSLTYRLVSEL